MELEMKVAKLTGCKAPAKHWGFLCRSHRRRRRGSLLCPLRPHRTQHLLLCPVVQGSGLLPEAALAEPRSIGGT